jgi:hypothetical protein
MSLRRGCYTGRLRRGRWFLSQTDQFYSEQEQLVFVHPLAFVSVAISQQLFQPVLYPLQFVLFGRQLLPSGIQLRHRAEQQLPQRFGIIWQVLSIERHRKSGT